MQRRDIHEALADRQHSKTRASCAAWAKASLGPFLWHHSSQAQTHTAASRDPATAISRDMAWLLLPSPQWELTATPSVTKYSCPAARCSVCGPIAATASSCTAQQQEAGGATKQGIVNWHGKSAESDQFTHCVHIMQHWVHANCRGHKSKRYSCCCCRCNTRM